MSVEIDDYPTGWGIYAPIDEEEVPQEYHVVPLNDIKEHYLKGEDCWCKPKLEIINDTQYILTHNSADGREILEGKYGDTIN